jgi:hypothetical protein
MKMKDKVGSLQIHDPKKKRDCNMTLNAETVTWSSGSSNVFLNQIKCLHRTK